MAVPEIIEPIIEPIGLAGTGGVTYANTTNTYDIAISGQPFFLAASQQYPYKRETAPYRRTQIDQTREPGEQTLLGWWLRSQSSFHLGAGVKYQEPAHGESVAYRFWKSAGVNPWNVGQVTLLQDVDTVDHAVTNPIAVSAVNGATAIALVADGSSLFTVTDAGVSTALTWGGTGTILAIATDGIYYYVANSTNIYRGPLSGASSGTSLFAYGYTGTTVALGWVKQRLIAGVNEKVWEIVPGAAAPTTPVYTNPVAGWKWTSIIDGPNSIYLSGYAGLSSSVFKLALDVNGALPTLTNAVTVADLPGGEIITAMASYVGKYIAIGTNLGVRVGTIDTSGAYTYGQITYGPLTVVTNGYDPLYKRTISGRNVTGFAFDDKYLFATVTNYIENSDGTFSSGLVRIDLSAELGGGMFAWATDLRTMHTGAVNSVVNVGFSGKKLVASTNGLFIESANKCADGYMDTGQIRYLTLEDKHFKLIKPRFIRPLTGSVELFTILPNGSRQAIMVITNDVDPTIDITTGLNTPYESVGFRFQFFRDESDATHSSTFTGYQLKALPAVRRARLLTIPVMCYDYEEDRYNVQVGYEGWAGDKILALENVESAGDTVLIQDFTLGETVQAVIESIEFIRMTPPERRYKGFGGVLYVTARTV